MTHEIYRSSGREDRPSRKKPAGLGEPIVAAPRVFPAVWAWSFIGTVLLGVEFYYLAVWVSGDEFTPIIAGPDTPPAWMRDALFGGQIIMSLAWCVSGSVFVLRPLWRGKRLGTDGLIFIGCTLASVWDALSNTGRYWFTYNSYLFNRGSIQAVLPITLAPHAPGTGEAWPIFFIDTLYGNFVVLALWMCLLLRAVKSRWPGISTLGLIALCFALGVVADIILEGVILLPLGFWSYAGGPWSLNADKYYKYPLLEGFCVGWVFALLTCLRWFQTSEGQTICERGLDQLALPKVVKEYLRVSAVLGAAILIFIIPYHLPQGLMAFNESAWPSDVVNRSYMTDHICGPQVNLPCPGWHTPSSPNG